MASKWLILGYQVKAELFDMLSDHSNVDHPLCEECTDQLLISLERQLEQAEQDSQQYQVRQKRNQQKFILIVKLMIDNWFTLLM